MRFDEREQRLRLGGLDDELRYPASARQCARFGFHVDVGEDQVRFLGADDGQRLLAVGGLEHAVTVTPEQRYQPVISGLLTNDHDGGHDALRIMHERTAIRHGNSAPSATLTVSVFFSICSSSTTPNRCSATQRSSLRDSEP